MALKHDALITSEPPPVPRGVLTNERAGRGGALERSGRVQFGWASGLR